jgi:hypothetical protein
MVKQKNNQSASKEDKRKVILVDGANELATDADSRYNTNVLKQENYPAFLLNGNTGQDGLSWQDNDKFGGGD